MDVFLADHKKSGAATRGSMETNNENKDYVLAHAAVGSSRLPQERNLRDQSRRQNAVKGVPQSYSNWSDGRHFEGGQERKYETIAMGRKLNMLSSPIDLCRSCDNFEERGNPSTGPSPKKQVDSFRFGSSGTSLAFESWSQREHMQAVDVDKSVGRIDTGQSRESIIARQRDEKIEASARSSVEHRRKGTLKMYGSCSGKFYGDEGPGKAQAEVGRAASFQKRPFSKGYQPSNAAFRSSITSW